MQILILGYFDIVKLFEGAVNVNVMNKDQDTALRLAAHTGNFKTQVKFHKKIYSLLV